MMINRRKAAYWAVASLALAVLLCALAVQLVLDDERLKVLAISKAQTSLERTLTVGDLSLTLRPFPLLIARHVTLSNPVWAQGKNLLEADRVSARLKLLPLLNGQVVITGLSLDGVRTNFEVSANGQKSWDIGKSEKSANHGEAQNHPPQFGMASLRTLEISSAQISKTDGSGKATSWAIENLKAHGQPGWRNVELKARILRNEHVMQIKAEFADLSEVGRQGSVSDGSLQLAWGQAQLALSGQIPLDGSLQGHRLTADFEAASLSGLLGFFSKKDLPVAGIKAMAELHADDGLTHIDKLKFTLGKLEVTGSGKVDLSGQKPVFETRLVAEHLDWAQVMKDIGQPLLPPKPPGQLFHDRPLAWRVLLAMEDLKGRADIRINSLKLRSGIVIRDAKANMKIDGDRVYVESFSLSMLNGTASGNMRLIGHKKQVRLNLDANNIALGKWLEARNHRFAMTGGPMKIKAAVSASGASMKALAATLTGPVAIGVGSAKLHSKKMQQAESLLTGLLPLFSTQEADHVNLSCANAELRFKNGKAQAAPILGLRSDASQLLSSGFIDLRSQTLDLRGKVRARSGISLGVTTLAGGNIKIAGKIMRPEVSMDPAGTSDVLARVGAAIMTGGASLLATAVWDAATPASDPCQIVSNQSASKVGRKP